MRLSILVLVFAICSSSVFAQNEEKPKNSGMINVLEPTFKGTNESVDIYEFLQENLITPLNGKNWGVVGAVVAQFNVLPTGNLSEIQVIESVSLEFDRSVISTLEATNGMWNPGTIDGRPVPMENEVTVVFRFEGTDFYQAAQLNKNKALHNRPLAAICTQMFRNKLKNSFFNKCLQGDKGVNNGKRAANLFACNPLILCVEHIGIEPMTS